MEPLLISTMSQIESKFWGRGGFLASDLSLFQWGLDEYLGRMYEVFSKTIVCYKAKINRFVILLFSLGEIITFDQLALRAPTGKNTLMIQGKLILEFLLLWWEINLDEKDDFQIL